MTTESAGTLAVREQQALNVEAGSILTNPQLRYISNTEFVPAGLRNKMEAILACVATGRALGLPDMTALRSIHIIDGKASFSAELMVMLVRQAGHSIIGEVGPDSAKVTGKRHDNDDTMSVEFTLDMADRAGLLGKANWKKYPESMLWARAVSQLCRMLFADCFAGASYTPEELGAGDVTADELMDEPAQDPGSAGASPPEPPPTPDTPADEAEAEAAEEAEFEPVVEPGPITEEQKDRLLELVASTSEKVANVGQQLTARIKTVYGAGTYTKLNEAQMDELLGWLEEQAA